MSSDNLPVIDTTVEGRKEYVQINNLPIELAVMEAFDSFGDNVEVRDKLFNVFGDDIAATKRIIKAFTADNFDIDKAPTNNLKLFSQLHFWLKYLTGGRVKASGERVSTGLEQQNSIETESTADCTLGALSKGLKEFNRHVAADLVKYWVMANKKLLNELGGASSSNLFNAVEELSLQGSDAKKTKYKADACFRYLYLFLSIRDKVESDRYFTKYLVAGKNVPQYTSNSFGKKESHELKQKVRKEICAIIEKYLDIHADASALEQVLMSSVARKSLLDLYEFEKGTNITYANKLKLLKNYHKKAI